MYGLGNIFGEIFEFLLTIILALFLLFVLLGLFIVFNIKSFFNIKSV